MIKILLLTSLLVLANCGDDTSNEESENSNVVSEEMCVEIGEKIASFREEELETECPDYDPVFNKEASCPKIEEMYAESRGCIRKLIDQECSGGKSHKSEEVCADGVRSKIRAKLGYEF